MAEFLWNWATVALVIGAGGGAIFLLSVVCVRAVDRMLLLPGWAQVFVMLLVMLLNISLAITILIHTSRL